MLRKLNEKYDRLPEPRRFLTFFLVIALPLITAASFGNIPITVTAFLLIGFLILMRLYFMRHPLPRKPLTWAQLGVPEGMVRENQEAARRGFVLKDPPPELVERTIRACVQRAKEKLESERRESKS